MTRTLNTILGISIIMLSTCKNNNHVNPNIDEKGNYTNCSLSIYSPYNCYYKISLNNDGSGNLKATNRYGKLNNHESDSIISSYSFVVNSKSNMSNINKLIGEIKSGDSLLHSNKMFDAFHFEFIIDQKRYIDIYGENDHIKEFLRLLIDNIKDAEDKCGIFKLFRQAV